MCANSILELKRLHECDSIVVFKAYKYTRLCHVVSFFIYSASIRLAFLFNVLKTTNNRAKQYVDTYIHK